MSAYLTSATGEIPDADIPWYCPKCDAVHHANARSKYQPCPGCWTTMVNSIWALPKSSPWRAPYDPPQPVEATVEGEVVNVERPRGKPYWRMTVETPEGIVKGTLPRRIMPPNPRRLVGDRVALEATVTWMEPGIGWYRKPRNARLA